MQRTRKAKQRLKKIDECSTRGASDKKKKKLHLPMQEMLRNAGSVLGSGRSPGEGNSNPF